MTIPIGGSSINGVESQITLSLSGIGAVASKTTIRKQRFNIASERWIIGRGNLADGNEECKNRPDPLAKDFVSTHAKVASTANNHEHRREPWKNPWQSPASPSKSGVRPNQDADRKRSIGGTISDHSFRSEIRTKL